MQSEIRQERPILKCRQNELGGGLVGSPWAANFSARISVVVSAVLWENRICVDAGAFNAFQ